MFLNIYCVRFYTKFALSLAFLHEGHFRKVSWIDRLSEIFTGSTILCGKRILVKLGFF